MVGIFFFSFVSRFSGLLFTCLFFLLNFTILTPFFLGKQDVTEEQEIKQKQNTQKKRIINAIKEMTQSYRILFIYLLTLLIITILVNFSLGNEM